MAKSKCQEVSDNNFLSGVEQSLNDALGYPKGTYALLELCEKYKGARFWVPSKTRVMIRKRNQAIRLGFTGSNYAELIEEYRRYGVTSERQIRRIIDDKK